ncbi:MAG: Rieske 2Fe-2S domain-containing protein, partial [Anaerolineae bacterium]
MTTNLLSADAAAGSGGDLNRREFLNYAWLASLGIFAVQGAVVTYKFGLPRLGEGEFGTEVKLGNVDDLPGAGEPPLAFKRSKFWWVNSDEGALALFTVCTHLGCIYDWKQADVKFICPCHGSQFQRTGPYMAGPAPRGLD